MKKRINSSKPIGKLTKMNDFLPTPEQLIKSEEMQKITIALNKSSIDFFKKLAAKHKTKYQPMIRNLIEKYVEKYSH